MIRRWILNFLFAALGALVLLLALNLAGFSPALVQHENVRIVLPPQRHQRQAQPDKRSVSVTSRSVAPKPQVTAPIIPTATAPTAPAPTPTPALIPTAPQKVTVDVNVNINVRTSPSTSTATPTYHDGVRCNMYQGCTHFWVDPPPVPIPPQAP